MSISKDTTTPILLASWSTTTTQREKFNYYSRKSAAIDTREDRKSRSLWRTARHAGNGRKKGA